MKLLIMILWCIMGMGIAVEYGPVCAGIKWYKQLFVSLIFLIGGPFFVAVRVLEALLDCVLPEGWDDDENNRYY